MCRKSRKRRVDEFGRPGSSALMGMDAPLIGAPSMIAMDALAERESGETPPPPPVSVRAIIIGLVVMLLLGALLLFVLSRITVPKVF